MHGNTKTKIASFAVLTVISVLLFSIGFYSFAWFVDRFNSGKVGFGAGELEDNVLEIAKIIHEEGATGELDESMREYYLCDNMQIEYDSLPTENGDSYIVTLDQMSFGFIDNVALLKPDNIVYFRFTVPKNEGDSVDLKFYYNTDADGNFVDIYRSIYDTDGETVLGQEKVTDTDVLEGGTGIIDAFQNAEIDGENLDCFLKFAVCVSNESYEATELSGLEYYGVDGAVANEESDTYYRFNDFNSTSESVTVVNENIEYAEEFYYVYIRVEPNLSVFGRSIEYISTIMPCYVYFKVNAFFEVHEGGQN